MEPNVFWLTKDWKEEWKVADIQGLLAQAQAAGGDSFAFHDVPSRAFCDEDTLAIGPAGMRCDEDTAELLHDLSAIPVPGTEVELDVEVHWDGQQFWLRPVSPTWEKCPEECSGLREAARNSEAARQLLKVLGEWLPEAAYRQLWEQLTVVER